MSKGMQLSDESKKFILVKELSPGDQIFFKDKTHVILGVTIDPALTRIVWISLEKTDNSVKFFHWQRTHECSDQKFIYVDNNVSCVVRAQDQ